MVRLCKCGWPFPGNRNSIQASRKLAARLMAVSLLFTLVQTAQAQTASVTIFTSETTGDIYSINNTTGVSALLNTAGTFSTHFWNGAAYDPTSKMIYVADIGTTAYTANANVVNTIYMFNPFNVNAGVTEVGTITGNYITGAGFHNGKYYTIGSGSNLLTSYTLPKTFSTTALSVASTQTLSGLGTDGGLPVTGLSLGDLDFVGNTLFISAGTVTSTASGATINNSYNLYQYSDAGDPATLTPTSPFPVSEGSVNVGVGIGYDPLTTNLYVLNANNTIGLVNQATGSESNIIGITGPDPGGAGDYTILVGITSVPEPHCYAMGCLGFVFALVACHRCVKTRLNGGG